MLFTRLRIFELKRGNPPEGSLPHSFLKVARASPEKSNMTLTYLWRRRRIYEQKRGNPPEESLPYSFLKVARASPEKSNMTFDLPLEEKVVSLAHTVSRLFTNQLSHKAASSRSMAGLRPSQRPELLV